MPRPHTLFRPLPAIAALVLFGWFVGCGGTDEPVGDIPYPQTDGGEDDDGNAGSGAASSVASVGVGPTGTSASSTGAGSPDTSSAATTTTVAATTTTTTTGGGGDDICTPDGDDLECIACVKDACCLEIQACVDEGDCLCWVDCLKDPQNGIDVCIGQCGAAGGGLLDLLECGGLECEAECGVL